MMMMMMKPQHDAQRGSVDCCEKMTEKLFLDKWRFPPLVGTSPHLVREAAISGTSGVSGVFGALENHDGTPSGVGWDHSFRWLERCLHVIA